MAWNKSLQSELTKSVPYGAPVTTQGRFQAGRGYHDAWDIERAYREGIKKVTWVARAVDAIAGNQARLPMIARKDNSPYGKIVNDNKILELLNTKSNPGENSFIFRHRLSSQLLISSRGAFVEKIRGRNGDPIALHLLPPQHTSPIPDPKKFVSGYEVTFSDGGREVLNPEDVIWFRHPHPLDPYLSMTPMEAAGIAIEIENLSKFYNRNFLINDGRPGGLLVVRGDMEEEDKDELRARFRGNIARAGAVSVIASEEGVDFVDTASSPRDASYVEMRQITKEEILAAFGVPESIIGNASGRTYANAAEEGKVFWMETMMPHLEMLARGWDALDDEHYFDFDTAGVPILILAKQEREAYLMSEYTSGLITANEYREGTGRQKVDSDLADSMLGNPNAAPIGNTERPMPYIDPAQQQAQAAAAAPTSSAPGMPSEPTPSAPGMPSMPAGAAEPPSAAAPPPPSPEALAAAQEAGMIQTASADSTQIAVKAAQDEWDVKSAQASDRWNQIFDRALERYFDRQQRVILEKARGAKARTKVSEGSLETVHLFDLATWNRQLEEDFRPVIAGAIRDAADMAATQVGDEVNTKTADYESMIDAQMDRFKKINETTKDDIAAALLTAQAMRDDEDRHGLLIAALIALFVDAIAKRKQRIAEIEAQSSLNAGTYLAANSLGRSSKTWVTRRDGSVRPEHRILHGKTVDLSGTFRTGENELRFPGDPLASTAATSGCRCRLKFS
jgi:HK97 family phage portal protein